MLEPAPSVGSSASRTVLGRGLLYTAGTAAPVLSNAVVTPFVTRLLGPSSYGVVAIGLVVIQVGMIVGGLGLAAAITRHGILEASGVGGARNLVLRGAAIALVLALLGVLSSPWSASWTGIHDVQAMAISVVAAAGFSVVVNAQSYLRVLDRPGPFVALSLVSALGGPVAGMALVLVWTATAPAYLLGLAFGYAGAGLVGLALTLRGGPMTHHRGDTRRALRIGLPTVPHQVALFLASGALVLVAGWVFGRVEAGRLQLAVLVGSAPGVLTSSLNNAWAPVVYRTDPHHRGEVLEHTGRDIAILTAMAAGFVALLSPLLLQVVASPSYRPQEMVLAVAFVAAGTVLSVLYLCNVHLVFASGKSQGLAIVTPLSLLIGTCAAFVAARWWDLPATGLGMTVAYGALALLTAALARRVSRTRWRSRALLPGMALGGTLCLAGALLPSSGTGMLVRVGGAAAASVGAVAMMWHVQTR